jgi:hypothetical protein
MEELRRVVQGLLQQPGCHTDKQISFIESELCLPGGLEGPIYEHSRNSGLSIQEAQRAAQIYNALKEVGPRRIRTRL